MNADDLFDATHYREVRRPLLEASALPAWCYTSADFYRREVERIFMKTWNLVGREDELPNPGDHLVLDMCSESVIVMRGDDGVLRAFANTCRHRGTRLLDGAGNCRAIICPYHGWTYARDGSLAGTPGMDRSIGFDQRDHHLIPVRLERWEGFVFVCFSDDAPGLTEWLGDLPEQFASYRLGDMVCTRRKTYDLRANWKIYVENAMEDYHTPVVHKSSIGLVDCLRIEAHGEWDSIFAYSDRTIAVLPEDEPPFPHIEGLSGLPAQGSFFTVVYPATFFGNTQDCMWWLQSIPYAADRMKVIIGSCFPKDTARRADFDRAAAVYYRRWDKALPEDNQISERQQAGLESQLARPGRLSAHEPVVHALDNWVLDRVLD